MQDQLEHIDSLFETTNDNDAAIVDNLKILTRCILIGSMLQK